MQEVEGWAVEGHTDYTQLKGDTGPLVYPAGFLYVYRALRWFVGDAGRSAAAIRAAQWVFVGVYLFTLGVVLAIYGKARPGPPWLVLLLAASKRLHSLFMLRLFNDGVTMAVAYAAILLFMHRRVRAGGRGVWWGRQLSAPEQPRLLSSSSCLLRPPHAPPPPPPIPHSGWRARWCTRWRCPSR